ncbi:MAG: DDE-type integrase/transposase/recombinase [Lachnospira sp.]
MFDITYIWTIDGFVYLTSIMDLFSRKIIAWTLSETLEVSCVIDTINKAKSSPKYRPAINHSLRSWQSVCCKRNIKSNRQYAAQLLKESVSVG